MAALLVPATSVLDWVSLPHKAWEFFLLRVCTSAIALVGFGLTHLEPFARHPVTLGAGSPILCALAIEIMILRAEGPGSPYYAGLNLCILAVAVLYTWRWHHSLIVSGLIVSLWLFPAIPPLLSGELPRQVFFNNLIFLVDTAAIAVASAVIRYRGAAREHHARTELGTLSNELAGALERLQEHDRLKNEFFANISHELRTPLTLILSPVEDLLGRDLSPRVARTLSTVRRNAQRLLRLIDDLLDLARLDARGLRLSVTRLDLTSLTNRVLEATRPAAESANVELRHELQERVLVYGDPHRLEIILTNLLGNALKFTPAGGLVRVTLRAGVDGVELVVADTGPGIAVHDRERIFDRFYQVEGSVRRPRGGAGIGLPLARSLAELHGGALSVESQLGQGATFTLFLRHGARHFKGEVVERRKVRADQHPGRRVEDRPLSEPPPSSVELAVPVQRPASEHIRFDRGRKPRVLVVEDERDLRDFIMDTLSHEFDVRCAVDGEDAMILLRTDRPDLVLTDLMMPKLSGTELCRQIKSDPLLRATPVILLTARSGADATVEGYAAGADDFVGKPFHPRVLQARVRAQLKLRSLGLQLAAQSRLASASALAAGIAHEVKNPLNAIVNAARALPKLPPDSPAALRLLDAVENGAQRIASIVGALEDHVRPADGAQASISDLHDGIQSTLRLLEYKVGSIEVHYGGGSGCYVVGSARELNQVLLNLLDNAIKAGPTQIWVDVETGEERALLRISDDGPGVPRELEPLLFEPFFTTRQDGQGTGLGLYLSRRMLNDCGGELHYRARAGGGAQFTIGLPLARRAASSSAPVATPAMAPGSSS